MDGCGSRPLSCRSWCLFPPMTPRLKAIMSWSSGKDSAMALHTARSSGDLVVVGMLDDGDRDLALGRVSMHGVREALLDAQTEALWLPC